MKKNNSATAIEQIPPYNPEPPTNQTNTPDNTSVNDSVLTEPTIITVEQINQPNTTANNQITDNEQVGHTVAIYAPSNAIWGYFSYLGLGINLQATQNTGFDITSQWAGQQLYSTLTMCLIGGTIAARYSLKKEPSKAADIMTITAAGALSLYTWDRAQTAGITFFQKLGHTSNASGYYASVFTGITEGLTQFLLIKMIKLLSNNTEYSQFKKTPHAYFMNCLAGTGLNTTIGAIPGAVWQLVYHAASINTIGGVTTGIALALAVALSTIISMKTHQRITNLNCYTTHCGLSIPAETEKLQTAPLLQCYSSIQSLWNKTNDKSELNTNAEPLLYPAESFPVMH